MFTYVLDKFRDTKQYGEHMISKWSSSIYLKRVQNQKKYTISKKNISTIAVTNFASEFDHFFAFSLLYHEIYICII